MQTLRTAGLFQGGSAPRTSSLSFYACLASDAQALQWQLLLGLGAAPALLAMAFLREDAQEITGGTLQKQQPRGANSKRHENKNILAALAGCGRAWFLYDVHSMVQLYWVLR